MALSSVTLNVRGLSSRKKQYQLQRLLADERLDFLMVHETNMEAEDNIARAPSPHLG